MTIEFDYYHITDTCKVSVYFNYIFNGGWENACSGISISGTSNIGYLYRNNNTSQNINNSYKEFSYPGKYDKTVWHHYAAAIYKKRMDLYIDNYLIFKNELINLNPKTFVFMDPFLITNIRIAQTKGKNTLDKIFEDNKLITHAIKFDTKESVIKPEYTGFIKQVAEWLTKNKTVSLEIVGYTDNEGNEKDNLILSKERAIAIKTMLVKYGVAENRIATKGCGAANPIARNDTPEGRANNRRIEFVKK